MFTHAGAAGPRHALLPVPETPHWATSLGLRRVTNQPPTASALTRSRLSGHDALTIFLATGFLATGF
jgi:hypothetical protein